MCPSQRHNDEKTPHLSLVVIAIVIAIFIQSAPPLPPSPIADISSYEEVPPLPLHFWVQKLATPLSDGRNILMRVEFEHDSMMVMPDTLNVYLFGDNKITFRDDGGLPDDTKDDRIYNAYVKENIDVFRDRISALQDVMQKRGHWIKFTGHLGEMVKDLPEFDLKGFDEGKLTGLESFLINATDCGADLKKENSLLITDLSVIEDPARTFNPRVNPNYSNGTAMGAWTFGKLIKNMVNTTASGISCKDFLKSWLQSYLNPTATINSFPLMDRKDIIQNIISPWEQRAGDAAGISSNPSNDWTTTWDLIPEEYLLTYAPFRLTAIVNRIDLRGNAAYAQSLTDAGETRFIFTVVDLYEDNIFSFGEPNGIAQHKFQGTSEDFLDWDGMNVILEYGNIPTDKCALQDLAHQWLDLSHYPLGSAIYKQKLEDITDQVTAAGVKPGNANGSALRSLRTDEKINQNIPQIQTEEFSNWQKASWEFRQFSLDASTHMLTQKPVDNSPYFKFNNVGNSQWAYYGDQDFTYSYLLGTSLPDEQYNQDRSDAIGSWIAQNFIHVQAGNFNMPAIINAYNILGASAEVQAEYLHYYTVSWPANTSALVNKARARQQYSLCTCQGCHTGETETLFTHVRPLGYGHSAKYWDITTAPDCSTGILDTRFDPYNPGNYYPYSTVIVPDHTHSSHTSSYFANVSAFLTGRNYTGPSADANGNPIAGSYDDDNPNDANDDNTDGLFYVNDPSNNYAISYSNNQMILTPPSTINQWGYNDLERRKQDLCLLLNQNCTSDVFNTSVILQLTSAISFVPFPVNGH